jgi:hypothetical protein
MPHFIKACAICLLIAGISSCNKTGTLTVYVKQQGKPLTGVHAMVQNLPDCKNIEGKEVSVEGKAVFELKNGYYNIGAWGPQGSALQDSFRSIPFTLSKGKSEVVTLEFQ